jgi:hypothetical protein
MTMTTGEDLNALYGTMISPSARVAIPDEWLPAIHVAMQEFVDLPTEIRAFIIVVGIITDAEGDLAIQLAVTREYVSDAGMQQVYAICDRALEATSAIGVRN